MVGPPKPGHNTATMRLPTFKENTENLIVVGGICLIMALPIRAGYHLGTRSNIFEPNAPLTQITRQAPVANYSEIK